MVREIRRDERPGLYCIELRTPNWHALVEWYREVLGLRVLVRMVDDGYALLEAGDNRLALLKRDGAGAPSARISLAFEVKDVPMTCARLKAAGAVITYPERDAEGLREANTTDPDGNRIRLFAWPRGQ